MHVYSRMQKIKNDYKVQTVSRTFCWAFNLNLASPVWVISGAMFEPEEPEFGAQTHFIVNCQTVSPGAVE